MGIARGTNIVRDGLVFGYDTGYGIADNNTATRFYPGKPTTNLLSSTEAFDDTTYWARSRNSGSAPTVTANTSPNPLGGIYTSKADKVYIPDDGTYPRIAQGFTPASTNTHHFSVWIRSLSGACGIFLGIFRNSPWSLPGHTTIGSDQITAEWKRFSFSFTPADTSSHQIYMGAHDAAAHKGNTLEFWGAQIEEESDRTPYTASSRSNTTSLIDLKRTEDISVANVSFDSNGQPEFDGTDDIIEVSRQIDTADYSAEFVFKADVNTSGTEHWLGAQYTQTTGRIVFDLYTDNTLRNFISGTSITGDTTIATGTWYHAVFTRDSSGAAKIYLNGAQDATGTVSTATPLNTNFQVGGSTVLNSREFTGNIAVVKVYNKVLSAAEVKQNFNAYKNRFNI